MPLAHSACCMGPVWRLSSLDGAFRRVHCADAAAPIVLRRAPRQDIPTFLFEFSSRRGPISSADNAPRSHDAHQCSASGHSCVCVRVLDTSSLISAADHAARGPDLHDAGMSATGKHFPGHGSVEADSHTDDVRDPRPFDQIENLDLKPFAALSDQLDAVMMAHVLYPEADDLPAGYSPFWVKSVLREKLGYQGTVFSDDLGMYAAKVAGGLVERVRNSLAAGGR